MSNYPPIADYGIIGDCRSAALISRDGSVDWLCLPRFDSPSVFGALLDAGRGGRFALRPSIRFSAKRRYVGSTNVLETIFETATGRVRVRDLMPVGSEETKRRALAPDHEVLRAVDGLTGVVEIDVIYEPRLRYGRTVPRLVDRNALGVFCEDGGHALVLRCDESLALAADRSGLRGRVTIRAGERRYFAVSYDAGHPAILPPLGAVADAKVDESLRWWENWSSRCRYVGPYRALVIRSALTLKLLAYAPSGAIIAAPTTSLPERIGGTRNWDYRYCWLRDASLTLRALFALGYRDEGNAFLSWLLHATRLTQPELQILYDVYGCTDLREHQLAHLEGYAGSRPVRVGNDAEQQVQLDIYGEVIDAAHRFAALGGRLDRATRRVLVDLGRTICRRWQEPDEGIWEIRSGRRHHTYSKVMCWVGLDRLIALHAGNHLRIPLDEFAGTRAAVREAIEAHGYNNGLASYVDVFAGTTVDASLLLLPLYDYIDAADPRMAGTLTQVLERLETDGLIHRYREMDDGLPAGEGAFGIASFWAVECRALAGDVNGAINAFERVCRYANDLGLFSEEIDPTTGALLGNFPQAFTHVGLINAAHTIAASARGRRPRRDEEGTSVREAAV